MTTQRNPVNDFFSGLGKPTATPVTQPTQGTVSSFFTEIAQRQGLPAPTPVVPSPVPTIQQQVKKPETLPEKFISTVKGIDLGKIGKSFIAGAKDVPGLAKQTAGIILGDWINLQKKVNTFLSPIPEPIREIVKKAIPGAAPKKAVEKLELVAVQLRETGTRERMVKREEYRKTVEPSSGLQGILEMAAYNIPQMAASTGFTLATAIVTKNPTLAATVGLSSSYGLGASEVYDEAKNQGLSESRAQPLAVAGGVLIGALDFLPLYRLLRKTTLVEQVKKSIIKKIASGFVSVGVQFGYEGITEGAQEVVGNAIAKTYQENRSLFTGVTEAGLVGMLLGGLADVTVSGAVGVLGRKAPQDKVVKDIEQKVNAMLALSEGKRPKDVESVISSLVVKNYRPDEAATFVLENNLGDTEIGKKVMLAVINADQGQYIHIEPTPDKKAINVSIVNEPKVEVSEEKKEIVKPEDITRTFMQKKGDYISASDLAQGEFGQPSTAQIGFMASDTIIARDPVDPAQVERVKADIQAGKTIEPIIVSREDGKFTTVDGTQRLTAYQELRKPVSVIYTGKDAIQGLTTFEKAFIQTEPIVEKQIEKPATAKEAIKQEHATPALDLKIGEMVKILDPSGKEKASGSVLEISRTPEYVTIRDDETGLPHKFGFGFEFRVIAEKRPEVKPFEKPTPPAKPVKPTEKEVPPYSQPETKPVQGGTETPTERIQTIRNYFEAKYGKPIEKGTVKEINEVWVGSEALPITPESEPIYKKVVSPIRGINIKYFGQRPMLLFGGVEREMFTDGYILISDKTVAGEINKKFVKAWEKDFIKSYQGANKELSYAEAEKLAKENTARLIDEAKKGSVYPKQEMIDKIIPKEWGEAVEPLGFMPLHPVGTYVYLSDEKFEVAIDGNKLAAMQKYFPDVTIHLSGDLTPVVFIRNGKPVGVLMPIRTSEGQFPKQFSRVTKKEEEKPEAPAYKGGAEGAAIGKFADLVNTTKEREERGDLPSMRYVPFPEIVRIVKNLTGKAPQVKKRMFAPGRAQAVTLDIDLKASIFEDPEEAARTLTHELGHITDYLPEGERRTGNLLGRIASLKGYFKHWLSEFPGGTGQMLTDKEKRQLRKEAEELAKKPVTEEREIVVSEKAPTTEEILDIWRTNTAGIDNPELLSYIQKLPDELKKDMVKAALKSTVPKWVTFTKKIKEKVTVGVIKSAPEDIKRLYKDLLQKEILKRRLIELKTVRQELQALSAMWRPFDRMKSSDHYVKYRDKPSELYADAVSVLFVDPVRLRETSPTFYKAYFNYLSQKPEVAEQYYQIQHLLNRGSDEVNKERVKEIYKGFEEGAQKRKEAFEKQMKKKSIWFRAMTQHISKFHPVYKELDKAIKDGKIQMSEKQKTREVLENMVYSRNDVWLDLEKNEAEVLDPLKKAGITEKQLGAWFTLERNLGDRLGIANPDGLIGDFNKEVKEYLSKNFTPEQSEAMQAGVRKFHEATFAIAQQMYNEGMIPEKVFKEKIEPYKDSYVTYGVVKYIDKNYVTPYLKEMIGTLEKIENPLVTTMYKRASMLQALAVHKAKKQVVTFLKEMVPDEITVSKSVMGIKHQRIYRPAPGKGQIVLQEDGKWISYDVDPYFEAMFKQFDPKDMHTLVHIAGQFNKYFKPIVTTYKLGWAAYNNPLRDIQRTMKNLAAISKIEGKPFDRVSFLAQWVKSIPEAFRFSGGRLTPLAKQALGEHAISTPWVSYDPTAGEDKALYTLYQKYRVFGLDGDPKADKRITQKLLLPIEMVLKALERTGGTFESTTKLAGFKYLSKRLADQGKVGFYTRNYVGTPNYLEGGKMKEIDNSIWVFSNVIFQGYRTDAELIRNPKSRGAWFFESFLQSGLWKLLMVIAASGFLGKPLQDAYENMSEYHKSNFLAVPLAKTPSGKSLYWTVPQDETNRLIGAIIWKTGMALQGKLVKPQQILDIGAGFVPTITPIFSLVGAWFDYVKGINPWDSYYGRNVLDQQTQKIRGVEGIRKMALWSLNEVGLGNFATYDPATKTTEEKFIQFTPLINRMFKVSDYGITEREVEGERKEEQQRAIQNKKEADLVKTYAKKLKKEGGDPEEFKELISDELYPEGPQTPEEEQNLNRVKKDFDQELLYRENDTRVKTIMKLKLNTSKINALKGFSEDMDPEAFEDLLNKLYDAKVISKDVFNVAIE